MQTEQHEAMRPLLKSSEESDVVVVGGGAAGFIAAYAAARTGAKTTLLDAGTFLGGTTTGAMVPVIKGIRVMRYPDQAAQMTQLIRDQVTGGFATEFIDRLIEAGGAYGVPGQYTTSVTTDPEITKIVMERMLTEAGVDIWFLTQCVDAVMEGHRIVGVIAACEGSLHSIHTRAVVDASGDGDVAAKAGAQFEFGRPGDRKPQSVTISYVMAGVNFERLIEYLKENSGEVVRAEKRIDFKQTLTPQMVEDYYYSGRPIQVQGFGKAAARAIANGDFPTPLGSDRPLSSPWVTTSPVVKSGRVAYELARGGGDCGFGVDPTDRKQMRTALISGREYALKMAQFYKKYVPGFEDSYLVEIAPMLGIRESRRIIGDYMLTEADARECRDFEDAIGMAGAPLDIHTTDAESPGLARDIGPRGWYQIPYRVLLPKGVEGLLVAGRCASSDHVAHASMRLQAPCMVTGHATGTAAASAAKLGVTPRSLDIRKLQQLLLSQGALITPAEQIAAAIT